MTTPESSVASSSPGSALKPPVDPQTNVAPRRSPALVFLQALVLMAILTTLFHVSRFLLIRAVPPFPTPKLVWRQTIRFATDRIEAPTLLACAVSPQGKIAMLDSTSGSVQVFAPDGTFLFQTPAELPTAGSLRKPLAVTFGDSEEIFVADTGNQRIVQFAPDGTMRILGRPGVFNGQFVLPTSMAVFDGHLYVLDSGLCRIQQFNSRGVYQARSGGKGKLPGMFLAPTALVGDGQGNLFVIDPRSSTLSRFDFLLQFNGRRRISTPRQVAHQPASATASGDFSVARAAFAGEGLSFFLSRRTQEILMFFHNTAVGVLAPGPLGLENVIWTDMTGKDNFLYLLDGKNRKVDVFEIAP